MFERIEIYAVKSNEYFILMKPKTLEANTVIYIFAIEEFRMKKGENYLSIATQEETTN